MEQQGLDGEDVNGFSPVLRYGVCDTISIATKRQRTSHVDDSPPWACSYRLR